MAEYDAADIGEKIKRLRSFRGMTCADLATHIGCTRPYLSAVENGRYPASTKILRKLAKVLSVDVGFFMIPGEPDIEDTNQYAREEVRKEANELVGAGAAAGSSATTARRIPVVGLRESGQTTVIFDAFPSPSDTDLIDCPSDITDANAFALTVEGEAMAPMIPEGATLLVAPNRPLREKRPVVAKLSNGRVICRTYQANGDQVVLAPYNHEFPVQVYPAEDFDWIYPVMRVVVDVYHLGEL